MVGYFILGAFLSLLLYKSGGNSLIFMIVGGVVAALLARVSALTQRLSQFEQDRFSNTDRLPDSQANSSPERPYIVPAVAARQPNPVPPPVRPGATPIQAYAPIPQTPISAPPEQNELPPLDWSTQLSTHRHATGSRTT